MRERLSKGALKTFWHVILSPTHLPCPKRNNYLLLLSLIHFFDKELAKNNRILWINNILNKLFLSYNSKLMNKFLYCLYLNKVRNKKITAGVLRISFFVFRNAACNNKRVFWAIKMKMSFKLCKRGLKVKMILNWKLDASSAFSWFQGLIWQPCQKAIHTILMSEICQSCY